MAQALWSRFFKDVVLENVGSTARDHLANERTYLAWLRTSLSVTAIGIAIEQLLTSGPAPIIGYLFVVLGMLFLGVATFRYFRVMHLLQQSKFETNRFSVIAVTALSLCAIVAAFFAIISLG